MNNEQNNVIKRSVGRPAKNPILGPKLEPEQFGVHTRIVQNKDAVIVRYHTTDVFQFKNGKVTLNTGGYRTATTKKRMNQAMNKLGLAGEVHQKKGDWSINWYNQTLPFRAESMVLKVPAKK